MKFIFKDYDGMIYPVEKVWDNGVIGEFTNPGLKIWNGKPVRIVIPLSDIAKDKEPPFLSLTEARRL